MGLAIVGKRNAGKSTLVNTLAGEDRVIVSEIAGTTRDAVDVRFEMDGKSFVAIDTAGVRKRKSFQDRIEWWALDRCELAIQRGDVCLFMIDATVPISSVDKQLGMMIADAFKPVIIVVNKWDLAEGRPIADGKTKRGKPRPVTTGHYEEYLREELKGLWYAPIAFMSAQNNRNVRETIELAFELHQQAQMRTTTGKLNRLVRNILERQRPASGTGAFSKLLYVAQGGGGAADDRVRGELPRSVYAQLPAVFAQSVSRGTAVHGSADQAADPAGGVATRRWRRRGEIARVRDEEAEAQEYAERGRAGQVGKAGAMVSAAEPRALSANEAEDVDWSVEDPGDWTRASTLMSL